MKKSMVYLNRGIWLFMGICLGFMGGVFMVSRQSNYASAEAIILHPRPTSTPAPNTITVYIHGEISQPDLYTISTDSRVQDAVEIAGGFLPSAQTKAINLAMPLTDGQQIYIPSAEEEVSPILLTNNQPPVGQSVSINTATIAQLSTLPGIGEATAQKIIDKRDELGGFQAAEELLLVSGIGEKKFETIAPLIVIE